jgi:hypothetical protein
MKAAGMIGLLVALNASAQPLVTHLFTPSDATTPPPPWQIAVKEGEPVVRSTDVEHEPAVCLDSDASSFSIQRRTDVDLTRTPILHLRWRVDALPPGADFRTSKDDQAAQFFVAFATPLRYRAINYIWDTTAPVGTKGDYNLLWFIKIKTMVVESGALHKGTWQEITRDVRRDYADLFGSDAPAVRAVRFQVNSQYTHSHAIGCLAKADFSNH